jgi:hypothetical protein
MRTRIQFRYHFDADPDPAYHVDSDPEPTFQFVADPDSQHWVRYLCGMVICRHQKNSQSVIYMRHEHISV